MKNEHNRVYSMHEDASSSRQLVASENMTSSTGPAISLIHKLLTSANSQVESLQAKLTDAEQALVGTTRRLKAAETKLDSAKASFLMAKSRCRAAHNARDDIQSDLDSAIANRDRWVENLSRRVREQSQDDFAA